MKTAPTILEIVNELSSCFNLCRYQEINLRSTAKTLMHLAQTNSIEKITTAHLHQLCNYWIAQGVYADTLGRKFRNIKRIFRFAQEMGYISKNPCYLVRIPKAKKKEIVSLTTKEIRAIENFKPDEKRLKIVRDFFLFQCYTGLSYIDVVSFDLKQILNYRNKKFIVVQRKKSGVESIIPLTEKAKQLLDLNSYKINYYSNQKTNKYLKEIAAECGIKKRLTTHVARKTFAQLNLENGMPIESVSRMLGHSSTVVTQRHYVITNITKVFNDVHHLATAA